METESKDPETTVDPLVDHYFINGVIEEIKRLGGQQVDISHLFSNSVDGQTTVAQDVQKALAKIAVDSEPDEDKNDEETSGCISSCTSKLRGIVAAI